MMNLIAILDPRGSKHRPLVLFVALMAIVGLACAMSLAEFTALLRAYDTLAIDLLGPTPTQ